MDTESRPERKARNKKQRKEASKKKQQQEIGLCQFFLHHRGRFCRFQAKTGKKYCGNHEVVVQTEEQRGVNAVRCPACTTLLAADQLQVHLKKCPKQLINNQQQAMPHHCTDINAGSDDDPDLLGTKANTSTTTANGTSGRYSDPSAKGTAAMRAEAAKRLGPEGLHHLIHRVQTIYTQECCASEPPQSVIRPSICEPLLDPEPYDRACRQFTLKHAIQQASVVGQLLDVGLVRREELQLAQQQQQQQQYHEQQQQEQQLGEQGQQQHGNLCVVELGAGKAGLAAMVVEALQPVFSHAVVMDSQVSFQAKSDRYIRAACPSFARYSLNLKDFAVWRTPSLHSPQKEHHQKHQPQQHQQYHQQRHHHCHEHQQQQQQQQNGHHGMHTSHEVQQHEAGMQQVDRERRARLPSWIAVGKHLCGAATDYSLRGCLPHPLTAAGAPAGATAAASSTAGSNGRNDACSSRQNGVSPASHCNGDEGPAGAAAAAPYIASSSERMEVQGEVLSKGDEGPAGAAAPSTATSSWQGMVQSEGRGPACGEGAGQGDFEALQRFRGLAFATCCHHRCGWRSYVGKKAFRDWGLIPAEFELVCWMTGWALCGHDAPPGLSNEEDEGGLDKPNGCTTSQAPNHAMDTGGAEQQQRVGAADGLGCTDRHNKQDVNQQQQQQQEQQQQHEQHEWDPARCLPREQRIRVGAMCKQLIDRGRLYWLCQRLGLQHPGSSWSSSGCSDGRTSSSSSKPSHPCRVAKLVRYIEPEVSGENKLLIARAF